MDIQIQSNLLDKIILEKEQFQVVFQTDKYNSTIGDQLRKNQLDIILVQENIFTANESMEMLRMRQNCQFLVVSNSENQVETALGYFPDAFSYFSTISGPEELKRAITDIYHHGGYISPTIALALLQRVPLDPLARFRKVITRREAEIISLVCEGLSYKQIAEKLFITSFTVNQHLKKIYAKLKVHSKSELVAKVLNINY